MAMLIMSFGSLLFVLGFVYVAASQRITERRKWVYRLAELAIFCFVLGVLLEGDFVGALIMLGMMAIVRYAYHRKLKFSGTGLGLEHGFSSPVGTVVSPARTTLPPPRRARFHDDMGSVPLTDEEELLLAGIRQGLRESSDS